MIAFQSSAMATADRCPNSPEGSRRLAGDNIPGNQSNDPRALEGRWKELIAYIPRLVAKKFVSQKHNFAKRTQIEKSKAIVNQVSTKTLRHFGAKNEPICLGGSIISIQSLSKQLKGSGGKNYFFKNGWEVFRSQIPLKTSFNASPSSGN
jgi:hypothetical protein